VPATPEPNPQPSSGSSGPAPSARRFTEPLRELSCAALLGANAVFLLLGFTGLILVIDGWASGFGQRSVVHFGTFAGPLAIALPMVAVLLATHVSPMVPRARLLLMVAGVEYAVSAVFGAITFLGAFAFDLHSVRATLVGLLGRAVWLGLLLLAGIVLARLWLGLYPPVPKPPPAPYGTYGRPAGYGQPYPGQPTYQPGQAQPVVGQPSPGPLAQTVTDPSAGWPAVPAPPMPGPLPGMAGGPVPGPAPADPDLTTRLPIAPDTGGEATQVVPAPPPTEAPTEPPTEVVQLPAHGAEPPTDQLPRVHREPADPGQPA
jgi:hypothetical protein